MLKLRWVAVAAMLVGASLVPWVPGCTGGANPNARTVGNQPGGVKVGLGDIAVSEEGYIVVVESGHLAVGWPDDAKTQRLPVRKPTRLAFAEGRPVVYVHSAAEGALKAVDVEERKTIWSTPLSIHVPEGDVEETDLDERAKWATKTHSLKIETTPDDSRVVMILRNQVMLFETDEGKRVGDVSFKRGIVDAKVLSDSDRALLVHEHEWEGEGEDATPKTKVSVVQLDKGKSRSFAVPNCSDRLAVNQATKYAFLAPTRCRRDPISVISLKPGEESFVRNLPGFGPVQIAPRGEVAVGFLDAANVDESLFDDKSQVPPAPDGKEDVPRYHIMTIDTRSLEFELHGYGDRLPRYAMTPSGGYLLIDYASDRSSPPLRRFDTDKGHIRKFEGPRITLDNYVMTGDSKRAYAVQGGLYEADIENTRVDKLDLAFEPSNINIAPEGDRLYLRKPNEDVCIYALSSGTCVGVFGPRSSEGAAAKM